MTHTIFHTAPSSSLIRTSSPVTVAQARARRLAARRTILEPFIAAAKVPEREPPETFRQAFRDQGSRQAGENAALRSEQFHDEETFKGLSALDVLSTALFSIDPAIAGLREGFGTFLGAPIGTLAAIGGLGQAVSSGRAIRDPVRDRVIIGDPDFGRSRSVPAGGMSAGDVSRSIEGLRGEGFSVDLSTVSVPRSMEDLDRAVRGDFGGGRDDNSGGFGSASDESGFSSDPNP